MWRLSKSLLDYGHVNAYLARAIANWLIFNLKCFAITCTYTTTGPVIEQMQNGEGADLTHWDWGVAQVSLHVFYPLAWSVYKDGWLCTRNGLRNFLNLGSTIFQRIMNGLQHATYKPCTGRELIASDLHSRQYQTEQKKYKLSVCSTMANSGYQAYQYNQIYPK